jgi:hypothetical protein
MKISYINKIETMKLLQTKFQESTKLGIFADWKHAAVFQPEDQDTETYLVLFQGPSDGSVLTQKNPQMMPLQHHVFQYQAVLTAWYIKQFPPENRPMLKRNEAQMLLELMAGVGRPVTRDGRELAWAVSDASTEAKMFNVERHALAEKLQAMSEQERQSVWDSIQCFWEAANGNNVMLEEFFNIAD